MPCSRLCASCFARRRSVSSIAFRIDAVIGVRVHDDLAADVPRSPPDHLHERPRAPQEALLVRVEDGDERHLGEVDPLPQEVDPDDDVVHAEAEVPEDLDALERVDLRVQVRHLHAELVEVVRELLRHPLRESRDDRPLAALRAATDPFEEVVDLALGGSDFDVRVDDAGGPDELLHDPLAPLELVRARRRAHVDRPVNGRLELLEGERPVVQRGREAEPEVDEDLLPRPVVLVHPDDLRDGHVALVDDEEPVRWEVVEERPRPRAGVAPGEMARVVLDAGAEAELAHHLEVERGPLAEPCCLEHAALGLEAARPARPSRPRCPPSPPGACPRG